MKVLIIGLGSIAAKHIAALNRMGVTDIFALRSSPKAEKVEGVVNLYAHQDICQLDPDFILISNITAKHAETINKVLSYNKPLFIEKPLFGRVNSKNEELVKKVVDQKIPTYIACSLRFLDSLRELKDLIKGCRINEVNIYSGSYLPEWRPNVDFRQSYSARKELGGGVHIDLIHELDYLFWICGEPKETWSFFANRSSLDITAVDYANYLWGYEHFTANVILNYYRRDTKRTLEVVAAEGTFLVDLLQNKIYRNGEEVFSSSQTLKDTLDVQMKFFVTEVLQKRKNNFNSIKEAYKILELCLKD